MIFLTLRFMQNENRCFAREIGQIFRFGRIEKKKSKKKNFKLPKYIPHWKCKDLDKNKDYPRITNYVATVRLGVVVELGRLSLAFPNCGKGSKFPANISKRDNCTSLIFTTGAVVTPGCESYYNAKYMAHLTRMMIEDVCQPILLCDSKTGKRFIIVDNLVGLTTFEGFKVVNVVSHGKMSKKGMDFSSLKFGSPTMDWNPNYFPGLDHTLTKTDVNFKNSVSASMTLFDSGKGVSMGVKCMEDSYVAYQHVAEKTKKCMLEKQNRELAGRNGKKSFSFDGRKKAKNRIKNRYECKTDFDRAEKFEQVLSKESVFGGNRNDDDDDDEYSRSKSQSNFENSEEFDSESEDQYFSNILDALDVI